MLGDQVNKLGAWAQLIPVSASETLAEVFFHFHRRYFIGEVTRGQLPAMGDINSIRDLSVLYGILSRELPPVRLEPRHNIHMVPLYRAKRAEAVDPQEELFDPIRQAPVDDTRGYWCWTTINYDPQRRAIRQVPGGRGSWRLHGTRYKVSGQENYCVQTLYYLRFRMTQYSLGGKDTQPDYAICRIVRIADPAAEFQAPEGDPRPPGTGQEDLPQADVVPPGGTAGESNEILQGHPDANMNTVTMEPAARPNKRRRLEIFDPSEGINWTIENENAYDVITKMIRLLEGQSTDEIRQSYAPSPSIGIEANQSTLPNQEGLLDNNQDYQRSLPPTTTIFSFEVEESLWNANLNPLFEPLGMGMEDNKLTMHANPWNANLIQPSHALGDSSTAHDPIFSSDNVNTRMASNDQFQGTDDLDEE